MNARIASVLLVACGFALAGAAVQPQPHHQGPIPTYRGPAAPADDNPAQPADVESIDAIVKAFYASTAGVRGEPRQWDRFRSLFVNNGRMIAIHHVPHGGRALFFIPPEDYIESNKKYLEKAGFVEKELSRRTEQFGAIAHVFSTYESRRNPTDAEPYARGIYSIQLSHDGRRWWIVNVMWDSERPDQPIPERYITPSP
jgi:hypothetical protein